MAAGSSASRKAEELCLDALRFNSTASLIPGDGQGAEDEPLDSNVDDDEDEHDGYVAGADADEEGDASKRRAAAGTPRHPGMRAGEIGLDILLVREDTLTLPDGRQLHFQECGDLGAGTPTFLFHGALGIGDFEHLAAEFYALRLRCICPSLPGWGESSPKADRRLLEWPLDVLALAAHLGLPEHKGFDVMGFSLGATHALACAIVIPDRVRKTLLVCGHAPFGDDSFDPLEGMDAFNAMGLSTLSAAISLLPKMGAWFLRKQASDDALGFVREHMLGKMTPEEKHEFESFPQERQRAIEQQLAIRLSRSIQHHSTGYVEIPRLLRSWQPRDLNRIPDNGASVMIVGARSDTVVPYSHAQYYARRLAAAAFITIPGGHMMGAFYLSNLIARFVQWTPSFTRSTDRVSIRTNKPFVGNDFALDGPQLPDEGEYVPEDHHKPIASASIDKPPLDTPPDSR
ncbi:MAG: alpha/beta hydrolase [archaeon]|nr:alpha/beta hydrolase [archaeon]